MNAQDTLPEEIPGEIPEEISEELVREALRPRRADPEEFAEAVRRKVAERESAQRDADRRALEALQRSPFLRQAAVLLPPFLVPKAFVGAVGKQAAWKAGLAVVALPAFLLVTMAATLFVSARGARALDAGRDDGGRLRRRNALARGSLAQMIALGALVVVAALHFTVLPGSADLVLGLLLASMISVLLVVRRLSRLGLASRRGVAAQCSAVLSSIAIWAWVLTQDSLSLERAELQGLLAYFALLLSGVTCANIARDPRTMSRTASRAVLLAGMAVLLPLCSWLIFWGVEARSGAPDTELAAWLEVFPGEQGRRWADARDAALHLHDHTDLRPSLDRARAALRSELERGGDSPSPFILAAAADMGLLRPGEVLAIDNGRFRRVLLERDRPITSFVQYAAALQDLLATGALDDAQRDRLADRLVATWFHSREVERENLDALCQIIRSLERMGRVGRVEELRDDALAFLSDAWIAPGDTPDQKDVGGFQERYRKLDFCSDDDEASAIWLMDRLGVPPGVDLALLQRHLRREALRNGLWSSLEVRHVRPAATLARFEAAFGERIPPPTFADRVLGWRLLIGTLLLVAMCLQTTLRAPVGRGDADPG